MAGMCNHTICRGNKCIGNNGCGLCLFGDDQPKPAFAAFHWVLENNIIKDNRWGLYMEFADWIDMAGNVIENNRDGNIIEGGTHTNIVMHPDNPQITRPPQVKLVAPTAAKPGEPVPAKLGQEVVFDASGSTDPGGNPLSFRWDFADGTTATGPRVTHAFTKIGPHSVGVTASNGRFSDLAYRDFLVYEDLPEFGTEGQAAEWTWGEVQPREGLHVQRGHEADAQAAIPIPNPKTKMEIRDDHDDPPGGQFVVGTPRGAVAGIPSACSIRKRRTPASRWRARPSWSSGSRWINTNMHAWKGLMPTVTLYESPTKFCVLRPCDGRGSARAASTGTARRSLARQRGVEAEGTGSRDAELGDHRVLPRGRRAVPRLDRRHGAEMKRKGGRLRPGQRLSPTNPAPPLGGDAPQLPIGTVAPFLPKPATIL